jgi:lipopolysaccharide biosynthesis regulator YciM
LNSTNELLEDEQNTLKYLRSRGAIILLATGIAGCIEVILNRRVSNKFNIVFYDNVNLDQAMSEWSKIINVATSFVGQLQEGLQDGIKNKERVDRALSNFTQMMRAVRNANVAVMDEFASKISN